MWDDLREQVQTELEQLHLLLRSHDALLHKAVDATPGATELSALAALLHSFYTGIENIFKRIAVECDGAVPAGEFWHHQILDAMTKARGNPRPSHIPVHACPSEGVPAIPPLLPPCLYLRFALGEDALVEGCEENLRLLEAEMTNFLAALR